MDANPMRAARAAARIPLHKNTSEVIVTANTPPLESLNGGGASRKPPLPPSARNAPRRTLEVKRYLFELFQ
jgi:hypothetical protein